MSKPLLPRKLLIQIHGYIAVFFLPMAVLYAITGGLYILGEQGSDSRASATIQVDSAPQSGIEAIATIKAELIDRGWRVPSDSEPVRKLQGGYYWGGLAETIRFTPVTNSDNWEINRQRNHWYRQMVEIHKDHAGSLFSILGFGFALGMFILILSGAIMMLQSPSYRRIATSLVIVGTVITVTAWFITVGG